MAGEGHVRVCGLCDRDVYDFSGLTAFEVVHLLASHEGKGAPCVRLHRRRDGTVITADCEVGIARRRKRGGLLVGAAVAGALVAGGATMNERPRAPLVPTATPSQESPGFDAEAFLEGPEPLPSPPHGAVQGALTFQRSLEWELLGAGGMIIETLEPPMSKTIVSDLANLDLVSGSAK